MKIEIVHNYPLYIKEFVLELTKLAKHLNESNSDEQELKRVADELNKDADSLADNTK